MYSLSSYVWEDVPDRNESHSSSTVDEDWVWVQGVREEKDRIDELPSSSGISLEDDGTSNARDKAFTSKHSTADEPSQLECDRRITRSQKHRLSNKDLGIAKPLKRLQQRRETSTNKGGVRITRNSTRQKNMTTVRRSQRKDHTYKHNSR